MNDSFKRPKIISLLVLLFLVSCNNKLFVFSKNNIVVTISNFTQNQFYQDKKNTDELKSTWKSDTRDEVVTLYNWVDSLHFNIYFEPQYHLEDKLNLLPQNQFSITLKSEINPSYILINSILIEMTDGKKCNATYNYNYRDKLGTVSILIDKKFDNFNLLEICEWANEISNIQIKKTNVKNNI